MSDTAKPFLICYDICDPKRLRRVHKVIRDVGMPVQFSVFLAVIKRSEMDALLEKLEQVIDVSEDKISFYHLSALKEAVCLGLPPLSGDLLIF